MKPFSFQSKWGKYFLSLLQHYNHEKYWTRRSVVINPQDKTHLLLKLYYLFYIKRTDAYHHCSFGTNLNAGTIFDSPPILPHGPSGIIVGHDLHIGINCTIFQQVTIAHGGGKIGDNVMLGAGSKILAGINIGNNVKVGANCVVVEDIPDDSTVVLPKPRIILRKNK